MDQHSEERRLMSIQQGLRNKHWIRALLSRVAQPFKVGIDVLDSFLLHRWASRGPDRGLAGLFLTAETELKQLQQKGNLMKKTLG